MDYVLVVRCEKETAILFRALAREEGRLQGKMLEILIEKYKKSKKEEK